MQLQGGGLPGVKSMRWFWLAEAIKSVDHLEVLQRLVAVSSSHLSSEGWFG